MDRVYWYGVCNVNEGQHNVRIKVRERYSRALNFTICWKEPPPEKANYAYGRTIIDCTYWCSRWISQCLSSWLLLFSRCTFTCSHVGILNDLDFGGFMSFGPNGYYWQHGSNKFIIWIAKEMLYFAIVIWLPRANIENHCQCQSIMCHVIEYATCRPSMSNSKLSWEVAVVILPLCLLIRTLKIILPAIQVVISQLHKKSISITNLSSWSPIIMTEYEFTLPQWAI